jgi:16S rRNA (cytosine1402-N4)-methyltransferase
VNVHIPVLVQEIVEYLRCGPGRFFLDCTVGTGGHAEAILNASQPDGRLIGLDWDEKALQVARERLRVFGPRAVLFQEDFRRMESVLDVQGIHQMDGILFDLGVSSLQLSDSRRGFSFQDEGPLDMRMDRRNKRTAADWVNRLPEKELRDILYDYGEERWSRRIARAIVRERAKRPIQTTQHLSEIVLKAVPSFGRSGRIHPATRTFQALRIKVNDELEGLSEAIGSAARRLRTGGRLCVMAFHSLEDRVVKQTFREMGKEHGIIRVVTRKPVRPGASEIRRNPRSRSAKLRVAEKVQA